MKTVIALYIFLGVTNIETVSNNNEMYPVERLATFGSFYECEEEIEKLKAISKLRTDTTSYSMKYVCAPVTLQD